MNCIVVPLYIVSAIAEIVGIALAAVEIRHARKLWTDEIGAPKKADEDGLYMMSRIQAGLFELFVGGRTRRMWAVGLLFGGVLLGTVANLISVWA